MSKYRMKCTEKYHHQNYYVDICVFYGFSLFCVFNVLEIGFMQ
jgi:hypothetical protein